MVTLHDRVRKGYPTKLETIADQIRARRLDLGLTLEQAAGLMGTSKALLHEWEKQRKRPAAKWNSIIQRFVQGDLTTSTTIDGKAVRTAP
jgi:DNA-binding transcriptional regulator YiaG